MTVAQLIAEKLDAWRAGKLDSADLLEEAFQEIADLAYAKAKGAR